MATNLVYKPGWQMAVAATNPTHPVSGAPVRLGTLTGVALTDEGEGGNVATETTVDFGPAVWDLAVSDHVGGGISIGDPLFYVDGGGDAAGTIENDSAGRFFGFALESVGAGLTATINVMHVPAPGSGTLGAGTIATANLAAGILSADATGRALFAAGVFDVATALSAFGANSMANAFLLDAIADGAFQADAATRALFADEIWTEAKLTAASLTGLVAKVVADANVIGGLPVVHRIAIADAGGNTDVVLTHKTRIINVWVDKDASAGAAGDKIMVCKGTNAAPVTEDMVVGGTANAVVRCATLLQANCEIAGGGTLRVQATKASAVGCTVYIEGVRVA